MLPYAHGGTPPVQSLTPSIAAPINPGQGLAGVPGAVSSAVSAYQAEAQVKKLFADVDKVVAETGLVGQQTRNATAEERRIFADEVLKIGQSILNSEQVKVLQANEALLNSQAAINKWRELSEKYRSRLAEAQIPLAEADEEFYNTWYGEFLRWVGRHSSEVFGGRGIPSPF